MQIVSSTFYILRFKVFIHEEFKDYLNKILDIRFKEISKGKENLHIFWHFNFFITQVGISDLVLVLLLHEVKKRSSMNVRYVLCEPLH